MAGLTVSNTSSLNKTSRAVPCFVDYSAAESLQQLVSIHKSHVSNVKELPEPMIRSNANQNKQQSPASSYFSTAISDFQPYSHPFTTHQYSSAHAQDLTELTCFDAIANHNAALPPCHPSGQLEGSIPAGMVSIDSMLGSSAVRDELLAAAYQFAAPPSELAVPFLPDLSVELHMLDDMLAMCKGPALLPDQQHAVTSSARHNVMGGSQATFDSCMADHMVLQESFRTLPMIFFSCESECDEAESNMDSWQQLITDCRVKPIKVQHLELYLDLSLADSTQSCPASLQAFKCSLNKAFEPDPLQRLSPDAATVTIPNSSFVASIAGEHVSSYAVSCNASRMPEQLPVAVQRRMQKRHSVSMLANPRKPNAAVTPPVSTFDVQQMTAGAPQRNSLPRTQELAPTAGIAPHLLT